MKKRLVAAALAASLFMLEIPYHPSAHGEEAELPAGFSAPAVITGFVEADRHIHTDHMPDDDEIRLLLPAEIEAEAGDDYTFMLPVSWEKESDGDGYVTTFWADWDRDAFPLDDTVSDVIPYVEILNDGEAPFTAYDISTQIQGVKNIRERALQQINIRWTPQADVMSFSDWEDIPIKFEKGKTYTGIPYGQQVSSGSYTPLNASYDEFLNACKTPGSRFYTLRGGYTSKGMDSPYYASDCSAFASYALGIKRTTTYYLATSELFTKVKDNSVMNVEEGDIINRSSYHVEVITDVKRDASGKVTAIEVCEQTPPIARKLLYSPADLQHHVNSIGYTLLRYKNKASVPAPVNYTGYAADKAAAEKIIVAPGASEPAKPDDAADKTPADVPYLDIVDISGGKESEFRITLSGTSVSAGASYLAAVWSAEKGQDDLIWNTMQKNADGTYSCTVRIADYSHTGTYQVHVYRKTSEMKMVCNGSFLVSPVSASGFRFDRYSSEGVFRVFIDGVTCKAGVKGVQIPVWSAQDQSDIRWYNAVNAGDGSWYADVDIKNHQGHTGTYLVHAYGISASGQRMFLKGTSVLVSGNKPVTKASVSGTKVSFHISEVYLPGNDIKDVKTAVWSVENGQDDLKWYSAKIDPAGMSASLAIDLDNAPNFGTFYAHTYIADKAGGMKLLSACDFKVTAPERNVTNHILNRNTGGFTVSIRKVKSPSGDPVSGIHVAVWSMAGQEDIRWYDAAKNVDGSYSVSGNIGSHNGPGLYSCHVYGRVSGKMVFLGNTTIDARASLSSAVISRMDGGRSYHMEVKGLNVPLSYQYMKAAVWSAENGQDDLKWYTLGKSGDIWGGSVPLANHRTSGLYYVHFYIVTAAGKTYRVGATTFLVDPGASFDIAAVKRSGSTAEITVRIKSTDMTVTSMLVPVWCAADQSDIVWYQAKKNTDGSYAVTVDRKNHKNHSGVYQVHIYPEFLGLFRSCCGGRTFVL